MQEWHEIQIRGRHDRESPPYPDDDEEEDGDGNFDGGEDDTTMLLPPHHHPTWLHRHAVENRVDAIPKYSH